MSVAGRVEEMERFEEIVHVAVEKELQHLLRQLDLAHRIPPLDRLGGSEKPDPELLREAFEELGPTFVKFGQLLAERKDLVPERYAEELKKLEDSVEPFPSEEARRIVDEDIGLEEFSRFDEDPIASASVAQVHGAELESGERVALKVRRPGIVDQMETDIRIMKFLTRRYEKHRGMDHQDLSGDVEQFAEWTRREMDFSNEIQNGNRLREILDDWNSVRVPRVHEDLSSERVVVMEYVDAVRCDDVEALEAIDVEFREIAEVGMKAMLAQIFRHGFFHADPHPSNFMVDRDGNLVFLDFGIMGRLNREKRKDLLVVLYSLTVGDADGVVDSLRSLGNEAEDADVERLKQTVQDEILKLEGSSIGERSLTVSFFEIALEATRAGIHIPNDIVVMSKGMATMEGIGLDLYPEYSFREENEDFLMELMREQLDPKFTAKQMFVDLVRNREELERLPSRILEREDREPQKVVVEQQQQEGGDSVVPALVLVSGAAVALSLPPGLALLAGSAGLLAAYLIHRRA